MWCLLKASFKKRWVSVKISASITEIELESGQFIFGRNSAAKELNMTPSGVWKRMQKLKNLGNLELKSNNQFSIITIMNWDSYQSDENKSDTESNNQVTTKEQPGNTNKNVKNVKKDKNDKNPPNPPRGNVPNEYSESFETWWAAYPNKIGKLAAFRAWKKIGESKTATVQELIKAINDQIRANHFRGSNGADYIPNPATWLNQGRWMDDIKKAPPVVLLPIKPFEKKYGDE